MQNVHKTKFIEMMVFWPLLIYKLQLPHEISAVLFVMPTLSWLLVYCNECWM